VESRVALGRSAEEIARAHLEEQGLALLFQNLRLGALEIDLVMHDPIERVAVIVEVRSRGPGAFDNPLSSITKQKRKTLIRATRALWAEKLKQRRRDIHRVRIDVVALKKASTIDPQPSIEWIKGAFTANDAY